MVVSALDIRLAASTPLGLPAGADIVVGHSRAALQPKTTPFLDGMAYASRVTSTVPGAGRSALVRMPCLGTGDAINRNTTAGVSLPLVLTTGTATSTATGTVRHAAADAVTTDTIEDVELLGVVSAQEVKAQAEASKAGNTDTFSAADSTFENISVMGTALPPGPVAPNTVVAVPGVGTLYLNRVLQ